METFNLNGWEIPINESLQNCLSDEEKDAGAIAFEGNVEFYMNNPGPKTNKGINEDG